VTGKLPKKKTLNQLVISVLWVFLLSVEEETLQGG
jgi:hypothetical protein